MSHGEERRDTIYHFAPAEGELEKGESSFHNSKALRVIYKARGRKVFFSIFVFSFLCEGKL